MGPRALDTNIRAHSRDCLARLGFQKSWANLAFPWVLGPDLQISHMCESLGAEPAPQCNCFINILVVECTDTPFVYVLPDCMCMQHMREEAV